MTSPFDPRTWFPEPRRPASSADDRTWLDAWIDLTTWWVDPAIAASQSMAAMRPDQALTQLVDGVARQFEGRRIDVDARGRRVRAVLDGIGLRRRGSQAELTTALTEVDIDGTPVDRLDVRARSVSLGTGTTPRFTAEDIDVDGDVSLRAVVAFVDGKVDGWSLAVDDEDRVTASDARRKVAVRVEPMVHAGRLRLELRSARWRGYGVGVPRWLRLDRSFAIPLDPGWTVEDAAQHGGRVRFRVHGERVTEQLDLQQLRGAVLSAGALRL